MADISSVTYSMYSKNFIHDYIEKNLDIQMKCYNNHYTITTSLDH